VVSGNPFENINIFARQPNDMSKGREASSYLIIGIVILMAGFWLTNAISGEINTLGIETLGFLAKLGGGVLLVVGFIFVAKARRPSSEDQDVLIVSKDGKDLVNPSSTTAFCPKCGDPHLIGKSATNFCPNCGNPFR